MTHKDNFEWNKQNKKMVYIVYGCRSDKLKKIKSMIMIKFRIAIDSGTIREGNVGRFQSAHHTLFLYLMGVHWCWLKHFSWTFCEHFMHSKIVFIYKKITYNKSRFFKRFYLFIFRERGREREREGEKLNVWLPLAHPLWGTWPETQAYALTGNRTSDPLACRRHSIH